MNTKNIRRFDEKGRLAIPKDLLDFLQIEQLMKVAICSFKEDGIMIRKIDNVQDCEIYAITQIDNQKRVLIPTEIRQETFEVRLFIKNGDLILEEAH